MNNFNINIYNYISAFSTYMTGEQMTWLSSEQGVVNIKFWFVHKRQEVRWCVGTQQLKVEGQIIALKRVNSIARAKAEELKSMQAYPDSKCVTITTKTTSFTMACATEEMANAWYNGITVVIQQVAEERERKQTLRKERKSQMQNLGIA